MEKRVAVVTGASRGIGLAMARRLAADGWQVWGLSRRAGDADGVEWRSCDVTDGAAVAAVFSEILAVAGRVDLLVCNAGMGVSGAAEFAAGADVRRQLDVNLLGAVACAQQVIAPMRGQGGGRIVFTSSLGALFPLPYQSFYSVSKAGLNAFSDALGLEVRRFGIETCVLLLNDVKTDFTDTRRKDETGDAVYGGRVTAAVGKMEASERRGMAPERVADALAALLRRRHLPPHKIVGAGNTVLGLLYRLLPTAWMLRLLGKLYG